MTASGGLVELHMDEVDLHPVDLGREHRQRVQFRLAPAPVGNGMAFTTRLSGGKVVTITIRYRLAGMPDIWAA